MSTKTMNCAHFSPAPVVQEDVGSVVAAVVLLFSVAARNRAVAGVSCCVVVNRMFGVGMGYVETEYIYIERENT